MKGFPSRSKRKYRHSFLFELPGIFSSIVLGISQTVLVIGPYSPDISNDVRSMGFGQIVALMMLAIPALTASEIYNSEHLTTDLGHLLTFLRAKGRVCERRSRFWGCTRRVNGPLEPAEVDRSPDPIERNPSSTFSVDATGPGRELLRIITDDIDHCYSNDNLGQKRIALIAISLLDSIAHKHLWFWQSEWHLRVERFTRTHSHKIFMFLFIWNTWVQVFGGVTIIDANSSSAVALVFLTLNWIAVVGDDVLSEISLRRALIKKQLEFRDEVSTSAEDGGKVLRYIWPCSLTPVRQSSDAGIDEGQGYDISGSELTLCLPCRQDTEADIALVPLHDPEVRAPAIDFQWENDDGRKSFCSSTD
jgi:hypothetical protein